MNASPNSAVPRYLARLHTAGRVLTTYPGISVVNDTIYSAYGDAEPFTARELATKRYALVVLGERRERGHYVRLEGSPARVRLAYAEALPYAVAVWNLDTGVRVQHSYMIPDTPTGLTDAERRTLWPSIYHERLWFLIMHDGTMEDSGLPEHKGNRSPWRLVNGATNSWLGSIEDAHGEEVLNLASAAVEAFERTYLLARYLVWSHNTRLLRDSHLGSGSRHAER